MNKLSRKKQIKFNTKGEQWFLQFGRRIYLNEIIRFSQPDSNNFHGVYCLSNSAVLCIRVSDCNEYIQTAIDGVM